MRRRAHAVIERGGVLREVHSGPPVTVRKVSSDDRGVCRLCVVNSAAGPLAGDEIELRLTLGVGARAELVAAGASIAQGSGSSTTGVGRSSTIVELAVASRLVARPAPLIVCRGARVEITIDAEADCTAALDWQETVVFGRSNEASGSAVLRWNLRRNGEPVLRSVVDLSDPELRGWSGMLGGHRVMMTALISTPDLAATTIVLGPTAVMQRIDEHTILATVLDDDAATADRRMTELRGLIPAVRPLTLP